MIGLLKLVLILAVIYVLYRGIQFFYRMRSSVQSIVGKDVCPACQQRIMVRDHDEMVCPRCGVKLARNHNGELLIRIN